MENIKTEKVLDRSELLDIFKAGKSEEITKVELQASLEKLFDRISKEPAEVDGIVYRDEEGAPDPEKTSMLDNIDDALRELRITKSSTKALGVLFKSEID